jgi:hypothetical protein
MNFEKIKKIYILKSQANDIVQHLSKENALIEKEGYVKLYNTLYPRIKEIILEHFKEYEKEFNTLTPPEKVGGPHFIKSAFIGISGFLSGLVEAELIEAQQQKNAEEYAKQKIEAERKIGFLNR